MTTTSSKGRSAAIYFTKYQCSWQDTDFNSPQVSNSMSLCILYKSHFFNTFKRQQIVNFAKITNYHEVYMEKKNNIDYKIILVLVYLPRHRRVLILLDQTGTVELMTVEGS